ncbi:afadin [Synchiropus picturatus]
MPEEAEREKLARVIRQWNHNRLDLFEISCPDQDLVFHGVMRFYLEDGGGNVATKCVRFSSRSSTREVIQTLAEKFRPDMKMLSASYSLFELHQNTERKLELEEKPLVVQLNWNSDNREGRFVMKKDQDTEKVSQEKVSIFQNFKRTLSKKEKKEKKKSSEEEKESCSCRSRVTSHQDGESARTGASHHCWGDTQENPVSSDQPELPLQIGFSENSEEAFLSAVINYTNSSTVHFKLAPAYVLYAAGRQALSRASAGPAVTSLADKMAAMMGRRQQSMAGALAFWLANTSELLNFLKHDTHLSRWTQQSQLDLSRSVHKAYRGLIQSLQNELGKHLPTFLVDPEQHGALPAGIELVLNTLMNGMSLLRRCRVNPALTIQLFSQLFHFISAWLFNHLMRSEVETPGLRSHYWGAALRQRLTAIEAWAERQGLELAADCHLGLIVQATTLLTMNKYSVEDVKDAQRSCFRLNSLQLHALLAGYSYASREPLIPPDVIALVATAAETSADHLIRNEGRDVQLEESLDLHLPFLLPEEGYSCDAVRGIPAGLREFLWPISQRGLCSLASRPGSAGDWTVFFTDPSCSPETPSSPAREPEVVTITLRKPLNSSMGVSIVAAKAAGHEKLGIYIKSIVRGGPAEMNGRLAAGDQLISVDGQSLVDVSQERAAAILMQSGSMVTLRVAKSGASFYGLVDLLRESSPSRTAASSHLQRGSETPRQQLMLRDRQFYRSNPNMLSSPTEDEDPATDLCLRRTAAISTVNLSTNTALREFFTLPTLKTQDKQPSDHRRSLRAFQVCLEVSSNKKTTLMRQALSQENLCVDMGRPLLDKDQSTWQEHRRRPTTGSLSHLPMRSSASTHDLLSAGSSPSKGQASTRAGVWRAPFSQQHTPTPSIQPIRIDIPVTRAEILQPNPALTTFRQTSVKPSLKDSSTKLLPPPPLRGQAKPQVSIPPTKHVSFQEPATPPRPDPVKRKEVCDPWRREAQEQLLKQQRLQAVELLQKEVETLQAKDKRSAEETERLRKLNLEWQFQKRVKEIQQREGEEEEEDEDVDMRAMIQQLEKQAMQNQNCQEVKAESDSSHSRVQGKETAQKLDAPGLDSMTPPDGSLKASAPERLPFKERQRLFSLATSA